jgi:hypothetical protein
MPQVENIQKVVRDPLTHDERLLVECMGIMAVALQGVTSSKPVSTRIIEGADKLVEAVKQRMAG